MEVGWHLRLSREDELLFLVKPQLAPTWRTRCSSPGLDAEWDRADEDKGQVTAVARRKPGGDS
jgi:hypothetical protein